MRLPSGLKAALRTPDSWPLSGSLIGLPVSASQIHAVMSADAVTTRLPSGLYVPLHTELVCPSRGAPIGWPVLASHCRAIFPNTVTMRLPSGLKDALLRAAS